MNLDLAIAAQSGDLSLMRDRPQTFCSMCSRNRTRKEKIKLVSIGKAENKTESITCHYIKYIMCSPGLCKSRTWQLEKHPGNGSWVGWALWGETNKAKTLLFGEEMAEGGCYESLQNPVSRDQDVFWMVFTKTHNMRSKDTWCRSGDLHLEISLKQVKGSTLQSGQQNSGTCCMGGCRESG